ncbi:hypothetical protein [Paenibacillus sp. UASWS1643]|uniref:hypothetical protein n=1 Tax=Paenibacillus sp. UASWS1643 TaxID=2580422 RepID=UPI00123C291E|nr:hypothetical protein [Paenibacillus sp. UASWS1643]KAA8746127.1 hypothetical protein FE296_30440 [Paenibacillus sp. UASWS1643]
MTAMLPDFGSEVVFVLQQYHRRSCRFAVKLMMSRSIAAGIGLLIINCFEDDSQKPLDCQIQRLMRFSFFVGSLSVHE